MSIWYYYYSIGKAGRATTAPFEKLYIETEQGGVLEGLSRAYQGRGEVFLYGSKVLDRLSMVTIELQDQIPDIEADNPVDKRTGDPHPVWNIIRDLFPCYQRNIRTICIVLPGRTFQLRGVIQAKDTPGTHHPERTSSQLPTQTHFKAWIPQSPDTLYVACKHHRVTW